MTASTRGVLRVDLTEQQMAFLSTLPAKVAGPTMQLMRRGWFIFAKRELLAGRNPAEKGWKKVLCDAVLKGATRPELEQMLVLELGVSEASAKVQASVGLGVFRAGRLIKDHDTRLTVSPD